MKYKMADKVISAGGFVTIEIISLFPGGQHPTGKNHYGVYVNGLKERLSEELLDEFWKMQVIPEVTPESIEKIDIEEQKRKVGRPKKQV